MDPIYGPGTTGTLAIEDLSIPAAPNVTAQQVDTKTVALTVVPTDPLILAVVAPVNTDGSNPFVGADGNVVSVAMAQAVAGAQTINAQGTAGTAQIVNAPIVAAVGAAQAWVVYCGHQ